MNAVPSIGPARHARVVLAPGLTLMAAVSRAMAGLGWPSANLLLFGGPLRRAAYHTSVLTPGGARWIDYGPERLVPGPAWLVAGCATFGRGADGADALHCHAVLAGVDAHPVGGHLSPEGCVLGDAGLIAHAAAAEGAGFAVRPDPATGFSLLTPVPA